MAEDLIIRKFASIIRIPHTHYYCECCHSFPILDVNLKILSKYLLCFLYVFGCGRSEALRAKEKLLVIWKEPAIRLQQVTAADSDLHTLLAQSVHIKKRKTTTLTTSATVTVNSLYFTWDS